MNPKFSNLFTIDPGLIYLNHAAVGPLPKKSSDEMKLLIDRLGKIGEPPLEELLEKSNSFRENVGKLISVNPNDIAFISNTTEGLAIALHSINWRNDDNVIVQADAFPASLYLLHHEFPHLTKKYVALGNGDSFYQRVAEQIDKNTRAIVVDHVHFLSGFRLNLNTLSKIAKENSAYLIVDGIQAVGAIDIDLREVDVDFYCTGGMKWLLGPMGTGFIYVNNKILDELKTYHIGWLSTDLDDLSSLYPVKPLVQSVRKFERANFNLVGLYGLVESLKMINGIGKKKIQELILSKTKYLMDNLKHYESEILTSKDAGSSSGIVSFKMKNKNSLELYQHLTKENIICSLREGWIRCAIHFFNSTNDINKVIDAIG